MAEQWVWSDVSYGTPTFDCGLYVYTANEDNYQVTYVADWYVSILSDGTFPVSEQLVYTNNTVVPQSWAGKLGYGNKQHVNTTTCSFVKSNTSSYQGFIKIMANIYGRIVSATALVTVNAGNWHTVKYDANGGSGAPGNQIKVYGNILTLSSTIPTKTLNTFSHWKAKVSGGTYKSGAKFGIDVDETMVAQWTPKHQSPIVTLGQAKRVASPTSETESVLGEYVRTTISYTLDQTYYTTNALKSITGTVVVDGEESTTEVTVTLGDTSITITSDGSTQYTSLCGTAVAVFPLSTGSRASLQIIVAETATDITGSSTTSIGTSHIPLEFAHAGTAVGLLSAAGDSDSITFGSITLANANTPELTETPMALFGGLLAASNGGNSLSTSSVRTGLYMTCYSTACGIAVGGNFSGASTPAAKDRLVKITTTLKFTNSGTILLRGVFPNQQSGLFCTYGSDGHTLDFKFEQTPSLAAGNTCQFFVPCTWTL